MSRTTYVWIDGKIYEKSEAPKQSRGPFVISDTMNPLVHPATGKLMDSKSRFRAETKARGCVEVGNDTMTDRRSGFDLSSRDRKADIGRAITELGG